jgi:hypothetical protein
MPTRTALETEGWSQNKQRSTAIFYDQHKDSVFRFPSGHQRAGEQPFLSGRPWWGYVERPAEGTAMPMPTGPLTPMGWEAPWYPPEKYIIASIGRIKPDGMMASAGGGGLFEQRFRIDYVQMIGEYTQAMHNYYEKAVREASALSQPGPDYGGSISYQLRVRIGTPPKSPKIPEAALAGNKWLLGQLAPVFNSRTQRWEVEEDEQLARLLASGDITIATAEQAERKADRLAEVEKQLADVLARLTPPTPTPPPPRTYTPTITKPVGAYQQFVSEQAAAGIKDLKSIGVAWQERKRHRSSASG